MVIRLFLETDVEIGLRGVPVFKVENEPFYAIPDEEGNVKKLFLLGRMNRFVVDLCRVQGPDGKDKAKQADGIIIPAQG